MNENKDNIIKSSYTLFMKYGFNGVSLTDIQKASGISRGTFYYYFKSKEEFFKSCVLEFLKEMRINTGRLIDKNNTFKRFIEISLDNIKIHSEKYAFIDRITLLNEAKKIIPDFESYISDISRDELEIWKDVINNSIKFGELRYTDDIETLAKTFIWYSDGAIMNLSIFGSAETFYEEVKKGWLNLYNIIKA